MWKSDVKMIELLLKIEKKSQFDDGICQASETPNDVWKDYKFIPLIVSFNWFK